jgi:FMN-dependent NADH-azoreductase
MFLVMTNLLHIDSSIQGERSVSREISAAYAEAWKAAHPDGSYTYRDLHADPLPHVDGNHLAATMLPAEQRTPEQQQRWEIAQEAKKELLAADVVLLGAPMYNFSVSSNLKAWLDTVIAQEFMADPETGDGPLVGKKVVVTTARGGSYAPGTPREGWDFQEPLIRAVLSQVGLDRDLTFVHTEMTLAYVIDKLAQFRDIADSSRENAHKKVQELAAAS